MATFTFVDQYHEDVHHGVHNLGSDQLVVALCNAANAPTTSDSVLADLTTIAYTNLSSRNITTTSSAQTSGTYKLTLTDLVLTASGGSVATFRYVVIYNDTPSSPADPLIGFLDYGGDLTLNDGDTLTIDFSDANGLFQSAAA
jgi:hypothetical protein